MSIFKISCYPRNEALERNRDIMVHIVSVVLVVGGGGGGGSSSSSSSNSSSDSSISSISSSNSSSNSSSSNSSSSSSSSSRRMEVVKRSIYPVMVAKANDCSRKRKDERRAANLQIPETTNPRSTLASTF
ncbi:hypothetical protein HZH66_014455 [Vespula vulgaris]|uniref:Uncharacterized protein n=1 Tax=Vespula vulgaris TaxID=7454 RepID=A0A834MP86_VESVU|nr:hypothetical protein HZH66_014455 [Vespula vulgaris]